MGDELKLRLGANGVARKNSPVSVRLEIGRDITLDQAKVILRAGLALQLVDVADKAHFANGMFEPLRDEGRFIGVILYWVQPRVDVGKPVIMELGEAPLDNSNFHPMDFDDQDEFRALVRQKRAVWRHIHAVGSSLRIADLGGPDAPYAEVGGWRFGWPQVRVGNKAGNVGVGGGAAGPIRHRRFLRDQEMLGERVARSVSVADWQLQDSTVAITETRSVTTWLTDGPMRVFDVAISLNATRADVHLSGPAGASGWQFYPQQSKADSKSIFLRPKSAAAKGEGTWGSCPWVVSERTTDKATVAIMQMDHPQNRGTADGKTRLFAGKDGRLGVGSPLRVALDKPVHLAYRMVLLQGSGDANRYKKLYQDFIVPVKVTVQK
jgi:hypothetical protein